MTTVDKKLSVLIVDDDPDIVTAIAAFMHAAEPDWEIDTAADGDKAIEKWSLKKYHVVLLDMMLPRKSGFLVLELMRKGLRRDGPGGSVIIMITGNSGGRHKTYAESLGVDGYLLKPFKMDVLLQTIKNLLEK
jgi:DNA-binding response OmpR family regulator